MGSGESGDLSASDIACLARIDRSIQELRALAAIGLVTTAEELVLLATSGRSTRRLTTFAQFPQVNSVAELLDIAGWPEKDKDISRLAGISTATEFTHLQQLKTLHARFTLDRIVAIGKLRQVSSVAEIAKLAVLGRSAGELTQLSQLNLVTDVSGLVELTGAVKENRTAADVVTVATSAASTLRQPSITDIVQLCALPRQPFRSTS